MIFFKKLLTVLICLLAPVLTLAQATSTPTHTHTPIPTWTPIAACTSDSCTQSNSGHMSCLEGFSAGDSNQCSKPNIILLKDNRGGHHCVDDGDAGVDPENLVICDSEEEDAEFKWIFKTADGDILKRLKQIGSINVIDENGTAVGEEDEFETLQADGYISTTSPSSGVFSLFIDENYEPTLTTSQLNTMGALTIDGSSTKTEGVINFSGASRLRVDGNPVRIHNISFKTQYNPNADQRYLPPFGTDTNVADDAEFPAPSDGSSLKSISFSAYTTADPPVRKIIVDTFDFFISVNNSDGSLLCSSSAGQSKMHCSSPGARSWNANSDLAIKVDCTGICASEEIVLFLQVEYYND